MTPSLARPVSAGPELPLGQTRSLGPAYDPALDRERLQRQIGRIWALMADGQWRTLAEIERVTGDPTPSISAQLRHLRKRAFGAHPVAKRRRGGGGTWEYRVGTMREETL